MIKSILNAPHYLWGDHCEGQKSKCIFTKDAYKYFTFFKAPHAFTWIRTITKSMQVSPYRFWLVKSTMFKIQQRRISNFWSFLSHRRTDHPLIG